MLAAVLRTPAPIDRDPIRIEEMPVPEPGAGEALLRVRACGVCRTDLHIAEGELPMRLPSLIPGHQIVGEVVRAGDGRAAVGERVGVAWIGGADGTCRYCTSGRENLCDAIEFTGYSRNGGYAEYVTARADFLHPLPAGMEDEVAAPLLCAGVIGFRSMRIAEVKRGQRVGLFGFGSSAQLILHVLQAWGCKVYVATREAHHQALARAMGADWVGGGTEAPPEALDCAVTFAPAGEVVIAALRSLSKGGIVAINAIHLDRVPEFDYDSLLWGERQIRSVANVTRQDVRDFLNVAVETGLRPTVQTFGLERVLEAMKAIRHEKTDHPAVILPAAR